MPGRSSIPVTDEKPYFSFLIFLPVPLQLMHALNVRRIAFFLSVSELGRNLESSAQRLFLALFFHETRLCVEKNLFTCITACPPVASAQSYYSGALA